MDYTQFSLHLDTLPGAAPVRRAAVSTSALRGVCAAVRASGGWLHALWGSDERDRDSGFLLRVALQDDAGLLVLEVPLNAETPCYPSLADIFPAADRMQRGAHDLLGTLASDGDRRPWLRHGNWTATCFPLRRDYAGNSRTPSEKDDYRFVQVTGDGVHEIAVGPVHAGIIEPGHFRFSIVGEKVLRLEERLGYAHKGIEKCFESQPLNEGQRLAARVSGDSAVAFSWAYCMAFEGLCGATPPPVRCGCVRCAWNGNVSPIIWATSGRSATMAASQWVSPNFRVSRKICCEPTRMFLAPDTSWMP